MWIEPSFLGNPWIQPRYIAKSLSTQMYTHRLTGSPPNLAPTTRKNSRYCDWIGSTSSCRSAEHDCQSAKIAATAPGSSAGSSSGGRSAATASGSVRYSAIRKSPE